jgi:hypothetical protein
MPKGDIELPNESGYTDLQTGYDDYGRNKMFRGERQIARRVGESDASLRKRLEDNPKSTAYLLKRRRSRSRGKRR